jgi:hypothetical protein
LSITVNMLSISDWIQEGSYIAAIWDSFMAAKSADCRPSPARDQAERARLGRGTG